MPTIGTATLEYLAGRFRFRIRDRDSKFTIAFSGIAYDLEEATPGICAAAIAFRDPSDVLLAVSVVVPAQRYLAAAESITKALLVARGDALAVFNR